MTIPDIVKQLRKEEKQGLIQSSSSKNIKQSKYIAKNSNDKTNSSIKNINHDKEFFHESSKTITNNIKDILELIQLIENVTIKIQNISDEEEIYQNISDEFKKSSKFSINILILTHNEKKLRIAATSEDIGKLKRIEKRLGIKTSNYKISYNKSDLYKQVLFEGKTLHVKLSDVIKEIFPKITSSIILKVMKYEDDMDIITPIYRNDKNIGVLAVTSPFLAEYCIPSVKNLSQHITIGLERIDRQRKIDLLNEEIDHSEKKYRNLVENSKDSIIITDLNGNVIFANKASEEITGYKYKPGMDFRVIIPKKYLLLCKQKFKDAKKGKNVPYFELMIKRKDGKLLNVETGGQGLIKDGKVIGIQIITRDITKRKNVENALTESENKFKNIADRSPDAIVVIDSKGYIKYISRAVKNISGYKPEECIGKKFSYFLYKRDIPKVYNQFYKTIRQKQFIEDYLVRMKHKNGSEIFCEIRTAPIVKNGKFEGTQCLLKDATKKLLSEKKLKEYEERYRALFENSIELVYITDFKGNFIDANQACFNLLGYQKEEMKNLNFKSFLDKGQLIKALNLLRDVKKNGAQRKPSLFKLKCKNGNFVYVETMSSIIYHESKPVAMQGIARDVTEREKSKEELEKLATIIRYSNELVNLANLDGQMIFLNDAGSKMLGIDTLSVQNHSIYEVIPNDLMDRVKNNVIPSILNKGSWEGELKYKNLRNGRITNVHAMTFIIKNPATKEPLYLANVSLDITKQKKAEEEIYRSHKNLKELNKNLEKKVEDRTKEIKNLLKQKDEFINQLGHDLKNPLTPLVNLLPILEKEEKNPEHKDMLTVINRNVGYMKNLVTRTIELARLNSSNTEFIFEETNLLSEINKVIETNKIMFEEKNIKITNNVPEDIHISADKLHLDELFNNLLNNSVKYSKDKGRITIDAKSDLNYVTVSISDTGIGMNIEQLSHVFEEFYKADESRHDFDSSGLGMPICKRIVERHGGQIWAESKGPGKGSTFYFTLPRNIITIKEKINMEQVKGITNDVKADQQMISDKVDIILEKNNSL